MFPISANSSEADAPPVWTSVTTSVEGGQPTAARGSRVAWRSAGAAAARATVAARRRAKRETAAAARVGSTERPPGGQPPPAGVDGAELPDPPPVPTRGPRPAPATTERPSITAAFRNAYHRANIREDIAALPWLLRSRGFLIALGLVAAWAA